MKAIQIAFTREKIHKGISEWYRNLSLSITIGEAEDIC